MVRKATIKDVDNVFVLVKGFCYFIKPKKQLFIQSFSDLLSDKRAFIFVVDNGDKIVGYSLGVIRTTFFANRNVA